MSSRLLVLLINAVLILAPLAASAEEAPVAAPTTVAAPAPAPAPVSDSYRKTLAALLEITGAQMAGEQVAYGVAQETLGAIAATGTQITEQIQQVVVDEALSAFVPKFSDIEFLTDIYAPLYAEHMEEKEVADLVAFYQSPLGQKMLQTLPIISQGGAMGLQQASVGQIPDFQMKVDAKLRSIGVIVVP